MLYSSTWRLGCVAAIDSNISFLVVGVPQWSMDQLSSEAVEGTPSYPVKCSNFTSIQFWYLDLTRGISGAVALMACSLILFLIILHKAYDSPLQRFLLYSTLATLLTEATVTMQTGTPEEVFWSEAVLCCCSLP